MNASTERSGAVQQSEYVDEKDGARDRQQPVSQVPYNGNDGDVTPGDEKDRKLQLDGYDGEEGALSDGDDTPKIIIPAKYRIAAIVLIILFGTGNTYAGFVLGPLKTRLVRELKISSESASALVIHKINPR